MSPSAATPTTRLADRDHVHGSAARAAERLSDLLTVPPPPLTGDDGPRSRRWWDQSLSKGAAGVAVLHAARGRPDLAQPWLARAVREDVSAAPGCGLWFGAPAIAFALHTVGDHHSPRAARELRRAVAATTRRRLAAATARIDARVRPHRSEFDLVRGLTGLGAHLLHTKGNNPAHTEAVDLDGGDPDGGDPDGGDRELLEGVLAYLVRLTHPVPAPDPAGRAAPGWWTSDLPAGASKDVFAGGHADLGAAHGISGPLALLSLAALHHIRVPGHDEAIGRIWTWLDRQRQVGPAGVWWPQRITLPELRAGRVTEQTGPGRPSWCYGTPGLARAQQLAGLALGDTARQDLAEHALHDAVTDPTQLAALSDLSLCHGWAGITATVWAAARDARHPGLAAQLPTLVGHLAERASTLPPDPPVGLIDGAAGVALTLHTATTDITTDTADGWARCLLLT